MSGGGGGQSTPDKTTTVSEPPAYVKPYAEDYLSRASAVSNTPYAAYSGQRIADLSPEQQAGLAAKTARATNGSPVMNAAQSDALKTISGGYLSPESNPWLASTVNKAMGDVQSRINSQFNKPGAWGSTAHQGVLTQGLGDIASGMYGANYVNERTNQLRAQALAPQYAASDYNDAEQLLSVGDARRQTTQDQLNQAYQDWLDQQQDPNKKLDILGSAINTGSGGYQSTTSASTPYQPNRLAGAVGGGLLGYGANSLLGGNYPYLSTAGGAVLGGLFG